MKNVFTLFIAVSLIFVSCNSSKSLVSSSFDKKTEYHNKLAIIPFDIEFDNNFLTKNRVSKAEIAKMQVHYSQIFQEKTESYLAMKLKTIEVQGIQITNNKLNKILEGRKVNEVGMDELADLLNVDAILFGSITLDKPMENDVARIVRTAKRIERTILRTNFGSIVKTVTNSAEGDFHLYDGDSGSKLWTGRKQVDCGIDSTMEDVANIMVRRVIQRIPYRG